MARRRLTLPPTRSQADPIDDLLHDALGGPWSDAAIERAGGPSHNTLRRCRALGELRSDAVRRLARVLSCSPAVVGLAVAEQAKRAKGGAT